jgi:hypothetical protein
VTGARAELIGGWFGQYSDSLVPVPCALPGEAVIGAGVIDPGELLVLVVDPVLLADHTDGWPDEDLVALLEALDRWAASLVPFIEDGVIPSRAIAYCARSCLERSDSRAGGLITRAIGNAGYLGDHADLGIS